MGLDDRVRFKMKSEPLFYLLASCKISTHFCTHSSDSFDLDMPIECDDEYWTHPDPEQRFKQPPGKPSKIAFFNCLCRLNQILAFALRTIVR